ncbi:AfsR/SARP family transcriptional regulator [Amycolatopsis sp. CA-126428]|uniref:AfsR/SARP family transcriptional regulator n=1 Tax=Amycolatopsis sp. CA-126428 TaxID=2073158 RepID=UPI000CD015F9|nr:BTAD domain-containing putative transcriptional regulator [Amycolatopsis sp. CA-126428]
MVLFQVLGPLEVRGHDGLGCRLGGGKPVAVLAALLVEPNAWITVDRLIAATWPEPGAPASAEANLKTYVWRLRRLLPGHEDGPRIESRPGAYRLRVAPGELDAQCAAEAAENARHALAAGAAETAFALATEALGLWCGRPYEGLDLDLGGTVARLDDLRRELWACLAEAQLALGRTADAVTTLRSLTADDPLREDAWARLVRAWHTLGRPAQALAAYHEARRVLAAELGVRPGPELAEALRAMQCGARPAERPPRRELPRDTPLFTGRARELELLDRACTGTPRIAVVTGPAGAGKTALAVHAAHRLAARFPDGQFSVALHAAGSPVPVATVLARLLHSIGIPPALVPADADGRAALWRSELAFRRVLLLFDDVADAAQVEPLLPATGPSAALITGRSETLHVDGAVRVRLGPMSPAEAAALFRAVAGERGAVADEPAVAATVRRCHGLPAALREAAATAGTPSVHPLWTSRRREPEKVA